MAHSDRIVLATSIPPKISRVSGGRKLGAEYQDLCVRSWLDSGFRVLSVNDREEIPDLAARYPDIEFAPADRNASAMLGRKTPYVADLFSALIATSEPYLGIINADLVFEPDPAWRTQLPAALGEAVVAAQRYDTASLSDGAFRRFYLGFDGFFFGRETVAKLVEDAGFFAMGLPWWDWWLPAAAALKDREVRILERPAIIHLSHPQGYGEKASSRLARAFADFVVERSAQKGEIPAGLSPILPLCSAISATADRDDALEEADRRRLTDAMGDWHRALLENVIRLETGDRGSAKDAGGMLALSTVFRRVDERLWAGAAHESAIYQERIGNGAEAARLFRAALDQAPEDFEILLRFGELLCRRGDPEYAVALLQKARIQQPDSTLLLNALGFALRALGRRSEAAACFEAALASDHSFKDAYFNLAVTLFEEGQAGDAIARLDEALAKWPDAAELRKLRDHFAQRRNAR